MKVRDATDTRYVYGASCTWHGSIHEVATGGQVPQCPYCGGVLFEVSDRAEWDRNARSYSTKIHDPRYPEWVESLHGPCVPLRGWDWQAALSKWKSEHPILVN